MYIVCVLQGGVDNIDGGMGGDIYQSMAEGVQGAAMVICFMTQPYQDSENCQLELKFAKQSGVPIVPVMVNEGWTASGWLGIVTAGALWTPFYAQTNFDNNLRSLIQQVKFFAPQADNWTTDGEVDEEEFTLVDRQKELMRTGRTHTRGDDLVTKVTTTTHLLAATTT